MSLLSWLRRLLARSPASECFRNGSAEAAYGSDLHGPASVSGPSSLYHSVSMACGEQELAANGILVLADLYRNQGDIARAVRLREALLRESGVPSLLSAKVYFEIGRDYRAAGFLDRAATAFLHARKLGHSNTAVCNELCHMYADSGDFSAAAKMAKQLKLPFAEAFYTVRQAEESAAQGQDNEAVRLLKQALCAYPASPEAWLAQASMSLLAGNAGTTLEHMRSGLVKGVDSTRVILLEGLHSFIRGPEAPSIDRPALAQCVLGLGKLLGGLAAHVVLYYYCGLFFMAVDDADKAEQWFTKSLVLDPDFWASRLALLALTASRESLPPLLADQITFFTEQGKRAKRFFCPTCGIRRDTIFSQCPRCRAWHSVSFRTRLT